MTQKYATILTKMGLVELYTPPALVPEKPVAYKTKPAKSDVEKTKKKSTKKKKEKTDAAKEPKAKPVKTPVEPTPETKGEYKTKVMTAEKGE